MRIQTNSDPFSYLDSSRTFESRGVWPCKWISCPSAGHPPFATAYRRMFSLDKDAKIKVHVSADERYELFVDGERVGRGPERGDRMNWFYESYELDLRAGDHAIVARVWSMGDMAPNAQMTLRPGFILAPDGEFIEMIGTGVAEWQAKKLDGIDFVDASPASWTGASLVIDGSRFPWGFERGEGEGWLPAQAGLAGANGFACTEYLPTHMLKPATLPAMIGREVHVGKARYVSAVDSDDTRSIPVHAENNILEELESWDLVANGGSITLAPGTVRRVIIDLENYYCAYPELTTTGGKGSSVRIQWAEALFENFEGWGSKGKRDEIEGKFFWGVGDTFRPDGGRMRKFGILWWQAGRYIELLVRVGDEPLTIVGLKLHETRYPLEMEGTFESSDSRLASPVPIMVRGLQMCSHETYMDCPYYEQLMYVGDTRLEVLATYCLVHDDRLPRKALRMFDQSKLVSGVTQSRFPSRATQIIPPFSLWWIGMVHDFAFWRDDPALVRSLMPGVRAVIDYFLGFVNSDGILQAPIGWNFSDWVPAWVGGMPDGADTGVNGTLNWHLVYTLNLAAQLEDIAGDVELAARDRRLASDLAARVDAAFWDEKRGLYSEDLAHEQFSEHTQCLAILSCWFDPNKFECLARGLVEDPDLYRATVYFSHYLFETYRKLGRIDSMFDRLPLWFDMEKLGFKTTLEMPEPSRSDCHGWGAHVLYHYYATILGVRPASPGFRSVRIEPKLGPLEWVRARLPHPADWIEADLSVRDGVVTGTISLPDAITGEFVANGRTVTLNAGGQSV